VKWDEIALTEGEEEIEGCSTGGGCEAMFYNGLGGAKLSSLILRVGLGVCGGDEERR